jgi:hypothetical protein
MTDFASELDCIEQIEVVDNDFFFLGEGSEKYILKDGIIRKNAYKHILSSKPFAETYLELIKTDLINFEWQTQHLVILSKLDDLIRGGRWDYKVLAPLFREAMLVLADKSAQLLSEIQRPEEIEDAVEMGHQNYEFNGLVDSTVSHARKAAIQGMIRKFAEQHSAEGGYQGDLYGSYSFELSKPRIEGVIPWLARRYSCEGKPSAEIRERKDGTWSLQFFGLIPFNDINRLNLAVETYSATIPVFEHALEMNAAVYWELKD